MRVLMIGPRTDARFILTAEALVAEGVETAAELQHRLREQYPGATVRQRLLEGDDATWYVYRDGTWSPEGIARRTVPSRGGPPTR